MILSAFHLLSPVPQLEWVLQHGTFLAQRWEADDDGVNLYHCPGEGRGFFVEVGIDGGWDRLWPAAADRAPQH